MFGIRVTLLGIVAVAVLIRDSDAVGATQDEVDEIYRRTTYSLFVTLDDWWLPRSSTPIKALKQYLACYNQLPLTQTKYVNLEKCAKEVFAAIAPTIKPYMTQDHIKWLKGEYDKDMKRYESMFTHLMMGRALMLRFQEALNAVQ